jgi:hypothetical protein
MIEFPTDPNKINYFERANNISINVFALDEENNVYPLKVCNEELGDYRDLLLIQHEETTHYCLINNFDRLIHPQLPRSRQKSIFASGTYLTTTRLKRWKVTRNTVWSRL